MKIIPTKIRLSCLTLGIGPGRSIKRKDADVDGCRLIGQRARRKERFYSGLSVLLSQNQIRRPRDSGDALPQ